MEAIVVIFSRFSTYISPAIGKPRISVLAQTLHLVVLVPAVVLAVDYGYETLYLTRSLVRLEAVLVNLVIAWVLIRLSPWEQVRRLLPEVAACLVMAGAGYALRAVSDGVWISLLWIVICAAVYFLVLWLFRGERENLVEILKKMKK